jgi:hypothetical protein
MQHMPRRLLEGALEQDRRESVDGQLDDQRRAAEDVKIHIADAKCVSE